MKRLLPLILIILALLLAAIGYLLLFNKPSKDAKNSMETQLVSPKVESPIFNELSTWLPSANWTNQENNKSSGQITSDKAFVDHFENVEYLKSLGFEPDINLSADGPGSSQWGYLNKENNQVAIFSYKTIPTSSKTDEPLQFDCPCKVNLSVYVGLQPGS